MSADAELLVFLESYPEAVREPARDAIDDEEVERLSGCARGLSRSSFSWDSSEPSGMTGGSVDVKKAGPARGEERHGRVCIIPVGGGLGVARTERDCARAYEQGEILLGCEYLPVRVPLRSTWPELWWPSWTRK